MVVQRKDKTSRKKTKKESGHHGNDRRPLTRVLFGVLVDCTTVIFGAFGHWYSASVKFILIPLCLLCTSYAVYELILFLGGKKSHAIICGSLILLVLGITIPILYGLFPPIGFKMSRAFQSASEENGLWLVSIPPNEPVMYPVLFALFVQFTNHKETSCMIECYSVESQGPDHIWRPVSSIGLQFKQLYVVADSKRGRQIETGQNSFNSAIDNKNIGPEETVQGWMMLGYPEGGFTKTLRIRVAEADGSDYTKVMEVPKVTIPGGFAAQTASMKFLSEEKDLDRTTVFEPVLC